MQDLPVAYWLDNTLYLNGYVLEHSYQLLGDVAFFLILFAALQFFTAGVVLWLVFTLRSAK